jgi:hypothetical protein
VAKDDITLEILREIREDVRTLRADMATNVATKEELRELRAEIRAVDVRIPLNQLARRVTEMDLRHLTRWTEVLGVMGEIAVAMGNQRELVDRIARCERDVEDLKRRLPPP